MIGSDSNVLDKLMILRGQDHFRYWNSLEDKRVCVLCDKSFAGHDVVVSPKEGGYELHCPTTGCRSQTHQWVYPGDSSLSEKAKADWWQALGDGGGKEARPV